MARIFTYIVHQEGELDDTAVELQAAVRKIDPAANATALIFGAGADLESASKAAAEIYPRVWKFDDPALAYPNAEIVRKVLSTVLPADALVLIPHDHFGMDLGPGLSVQLDAAYAPDVIEIDGMRGSTLEVVRQEYNGMVHAHLTCDASAGLVMTVRPGACPAAAAGDEPGQVADRSDQAGDLSTKRRFTNTIEADTGGVDITKADVLVSVGRGIEDEENLELVTDLADTMGAEVSCSRPIVDAQWMEKSRQVGTSGKTVKPKVYLALGISGSFQHMGGLKGAPFIVAVNKNPKAPIFQVADVGIVDDILDVIPALAEKIG